MVQYETETLEVEMAQCAGQLFGERITNGIGVTNPFALHDFNCLLVNRLRRKRIDFYWCDGLSPESYIQGSLFLLICLATWAAPPSEIAYQVKSRLNTLVPMAGRATQKCWYL